MLKKVVLCVLAIVFVLGCSKSIVGDWTANGPGGAVTLTFKGDGTFDAKGGDKATTVFSGTYTVKDKTVSMTMTKMMGMDVPKGTGADTPQNITLSDDGKSMTIEGMTFTKQ